VLDSGLRTRSLPRCSCRCVRLDDVHALHALKQVYSLSFPQTVTATLLGDISDSHSGEYEDGCLLSNDSWVIALMMEAASTSETSVNFYQTTRRNNSEDSHLHTACFRMLEQRPRMGSEKTNASIPRSDESNCIEPFFSEFYFVHIVSYSSGLLFGMSNYGNVNKQTLCGNYSDLFRQDSVKLCLWLCFTARETTAQSLLHTESFDYHLTEQIMKGIYQIIRPRSRPYVTLRNVLAFEVRCFKTLPNLQAWAPPLVDVRECWFIILVATFRISRSSPLEGNIAGASKEYFTSLSFCRFRGDFICFKEKGHA
jgi:hypothetical protein